jgi:hypothetical protein
MVRFEEDEARGLLEFYEKSENRDYLLHVFREGSRTVNERFSKATRSKVSLHIMRVLNMFHEHEDEIRFAIVEHVDLIHLYYLICRWRFAIYTSSYNGLVDRILARLQANGNDFFSRLQQIQYEDFSVFLEAATSYNRAMDVLDLFSLDQKKILLMEVFQRLQKEASLELAVALTEVFLTTPSHEIVDYLGELFSHAVEVKSVDSVSASTSVTDMEGIEEFEMDSDPGEKAVQADELVHLMIAAISSFAEQSVEKNIPTTIVYKVETSPFHFYSEPAEVASTDTLLQKVASEEPVPIESAPEDVKLLVKSLRHWKEWADNLLLDNPEYALPDYTTLNSERLFNEEGVNVQRHYFFNDLDGRTTFFVFRRQYEQDPNWTVTDKGRFILIQRINPFSGRRVLIIANKPRHWKSSRPAIQQLILKNGGVFQTFVHRGHSYKVGYAVPDITTKTATTILGSCGGFENIQRVLGLSLFTHIILSKGKGTIWVNNTLLKQYNEFVLTGDNIIWPNFKESVRAAIKEALKHRDIKDEVLYIYDHFYTFPHENIGMALMRRYVELETKRTRPVYVIPVSHKDWDGKKEECETDECRKKLKMKKKWDRVLENRQRRYDDDTTVELPQEEEPAVQEAPPVKHPDMPAYLYTQP